MSRWETKINNKNGTTLVVRTSASKYCETPLRIPPGTISEAEISGERNQIMKKEELHRHLVADCEGGRFLSADD